MMIMNIVWSTCRQRKAPSKNLCLSYTRKKRFGISLNRICFSEICKASYGQNRHNRWWCTFFKPVDFFPQRTQKGFKQGLSREHLANPHVIWWKYQIHHSKYRMLRLMWSIFVANLHPFWRTFHTPKNACCNKNGKYQYHRNIYWVTFSRSCWSIGHPKTAPLVGPTPKFSPKFSFSFSNSPLSIFTFLRDITLKQSILKWGRKFI